MAQPRLPARRKVSVAHATSNPATLARNAAREKYTGRKSQTLIRIVGQAPLKATVFEMERLRCNACGQVFTADEPEAAGPEKYDATAVAMIALLKYGTGVPFNRMERLEDNWGCRCRRPRSGS